jgi:hypothetical protein
MNKTAPNSDNFRYLRGLTAFDWLVFVGGLINLAVVATIFGYAIIYL